MNNKWYYKAFDINVNMTILTNTYYEKLPRKWSYYFLEEFEKVRQDDADSLGARIEFLKKKLAELCDASKFGGPLITHQPAKNLWILCNLIPHRCVSFIGIHNLTKIRQSLICTGSSI